MKLYNTKVRKKEEFVPKKGKEVLMYVCGITPYDTTHLGHAFTYVFFDILKRYLTFKGYEVKYVQNVTDIDDDIIRKAKETDQNWKKLGDFWTKNFLKDIKSLNILLPDYYVKATDSIALMIHLIKMLIKHNHAYERNGNVYFEIKNFKDYGQLSKLNRNQMLLLSKERGGNPDDLLKKDPLDFVLWQKSAEDEPFWQSPWGKGMPGWHIECSALINQYLGNQIDIHGGGKDLIFPHHENEIAQSESFSGKKPFVKYWVHTSMVMYEGEKMAKSLGNLVMISDLLKKYSPNVIRWILLSHHYRQPWEFEEEELINAEKTLVKINNELKKVKRTEAERRNEIYMKRFIHFMDNDLNTPDALKLITNLAKIPSLQQTLKTCLSVLGFQI